MVNCAGILKAGAFGSEKCNLQNFMDNFNVNTKAVFQLMNESVEPLRAAGREVRLYINNFLRVCLFYER